MNNQIPTPKDITELIMSSLPPDISNNIALNNVVLATVSNLANEPITINELYNMILNAKPYIMSFLSEIQLTATVKETLETYTLTIVIFQYIVMFLLFCIIIIVLMINRILSTAAGIVIIILVIVFLLIIAGLQLYTIADNLENIDTDFVNIFNNAVNKYGNNLLLNGALGYVSGAQLTVNGPPGGTYGTGPTGSVPGFGYIILDEPDNPKPFFLSPPYYKLNVIRTRTPQSYSTPPAIFRMLLAEPLIAESATSSFYFNSLKPQYGKVIYVTNGNSKDQDSSGNIIPADTGIIMILNATSYYPTHVHSSGNSVPNTGIYVSVLDGPLSRYEGTLLYPGETKCFINVGINRQYTIPDQDIPPLAVSAWVELNADSRPFNTSFNSTSMNNNFPRITGKIMYLNVPNGATIDFTQSNSLNTAVLGQELYIVANPSPSTTTISGSGNLVINPTNAFITVIVNSTTTITLIKDQTACIVLNNNATPQWDLVYPI